MALLHSVMIGMLGRIADRFHEYQPTADLSQRLEMARRVQGSDGIEVVYPTEFSNPAETVHLLKESGLAISALNLNLKGEKIWEHGSFTSPDPQVRARAVDALKTALDLAAELGTDMVSCCPLIDGHNYAFEVDYLQQWVWLIEGVREGAAHRQDVRLSLEYKLNESRNFNLLSDVGRTLYLCEVIGLPQIGVTLDIGHSLIARETPAEALCLAAQAKRLFYIHFNDNGREWDWDMLPGSVNFWDLIESLYYIRKLGWSGWLSYDVVTRGDDLVRSMGTSISIVKIADLFIDKVGQENIEALIQQGAPSVTFETLMRKIL